MAACPMAVETLRSTVGNGKATNDRDQNVDWSNINPIAKDISFLNDQVCHLQRSGPSSHPDDLNYSVAWFAHHRQREAIFGPWYPTLGALSHPWESLRIQSIQNFWKATQDHKISLPTIHLAVWVLNKLLISFSQKHGMKFNKEIFAGVTAVSFRIALKFEERPDSLWGIRRIWEVLPVFASWSINRSDQFLLRIEAEALRILDDSFDVPLAVQFFDKYITIGGWPTELVKEYTSLGHFLLALSTFAAGENHPLTNVPPSMLAAATVVLSVKIVNGDTKRTYEYFPERFAAFCDTTLKDLQPSIKGLSSMLRRKPAEATILGRIYPEWGEHEWQ